MEKKNISILIVDDIDYNIELLTEMLSDCYHIIAAKSGRRALEILRADPKAADAVLLDIIMPEMSGYEVLEELRKDEKLRTIPVITITSDEDPASKQKAFDLGAVDFVPRGSDIASLHHRINTVLRLCEMEKIRVENELLRSQIRSEKHLRALMENLPGGVAVIETDGKTASCAYYNGRLPALFGMTEEQFSAQFTAKEYPAWIKSFIIEARNDSRFSYIFSLGEESENAQWIRMIASSLSETGDKREIYCVFLDINSEKRQEKLTKEAERKLRDNEVQLETLINNAPGGISLSQLDENGDMKTIYVSPGLAEMLGYPDYKTCMGVVLSSSTAGISEDDAKNIRAQIEASAKSGEQVKYTFECRSYDNKTLWLKLTGQLRIYGENRRFYSFVTNITKEKEFEKELRSVAYFDQLTGCYNRAAFLKAAGYLLSENPLTEYSMLKFNVGNFKVVNDLLGRDAGDELLKIISAALAAEVGEDGVYARLYADQFAIMIPYSERAVHPQSLVGAVHSAVAKSGLATSELHFYVGVYKITDRAISVSNMIDRAAIACRSVTGSFREHVAYYDEKLRQRMLEEQKICDECYRAIKNNEFCVYYQGVYGIKQRAFVSAEALIRWNHPTNGMISPGKFIPVFEKNGFVAELDLYVVEQVCVYHQKRREAGLEPFPVSVNISRISLHNPKLFDAIDRLARRYKVEPKYLRIEITESAYNSNSSLLLETTKKLRAKGYPVLMDDFGSGYSSLNTLKDIPFDILKLDMKFMEGFETNPKVGIIVTSMSRMAKWLNVPLLAEGVETREQFEFLESVGCAYIQGFYFSRPAPEDEFTRIISEKCVTGKASDIEDYKMGSEIDALFGSDSLVSKLIGSVLGGVGIYELTEEKLEVLRVNEEYMNIMGFDPDDNFLEENTNVWGRVYPDDVPISRSACFEAVRTGKPVRAVVRRFNKNDDIIYLDSIHRHLGGTKNHPIIFISMYDITDKVMEEERKNIAGMGEDELLKREAERSDILLRKTVRHIPVGLGIFKLEENGPVPVYFSDKMYKILGTKNNLELFGSDKAAQFVEQYKVAPGSSGEHVFTYMRPDGKHVSLKANYRAMDENGTTMVYAVISDISEQIEARKQEIVRDQMYQVLIEESNTIIFNYSPDTDELTYFKNTEDGYSQRFTLEKVTSNFKDISVIYEDDRKAFADTLKKLSDTEMSDSASIRIFVEGYPRRHKATFKSISDSDGVVFRVVGKLEDVDDEMSRLEEIQARAMYDSLCVDVYNKATTEELIRAELERSTTGALLMIDVDDFKSINDRLGHMFGDEFLKIFAATVKSIFRETDIIGRYGGDEFFVFMPHATAALSERKGRQILERVAKINIPELSSIKSSIGISVANPENRKYRQLLKQADSALYQAKNRGKNCVVLFDPHSMSEGVYRTDEAVSKGRSDVVLSSNPGGSGNALITRVFSALYSGADFENGINQALSLVGKNFDVSRVYIFENSDDGKYCANTFEWCAEGVAPEIDTLQNISYKDDLEGVYDTIWNDDGIFYCHDVSELKDPVRGILERQGIKSVLQCAIFEDGKYKGFLGFDECRSNRFWTQEQIDSLVFLSKILAVFLLKNRTSRRSENYARSLRSVIDEDPKIVYIIDKTTREMLFANKAARDAIFEAGHGDETPDPDKYSFLNEITAPTDIIVFSDILGKKLHVKTMAIEWEGRQAYLVNNEIVEE